MDDTNLTSTKFLLAILLVIIGAVLVFMDKVTFDQFSALVAPVVGFYFAANVVGKASSAVGEYFGAKAEMAIEKKESEAL